MRKSQYPISTVNTFNISELLFFRNRPTSRSVSTAVDFGPPHHYHRVFSALHYEFQEQPRESAEQSSKGQPVREAQGAPPIRDHRDLHVAPGMNCIKIGLPGKSILEDYFQENGTFRRPFLLLKISFPQRLFMQLPPVAQRRRLQCRVVRLQPRRRQRSRPQPQPP